MLVSFVYGPLAASRRYESDTCVGVSRANALAKKGDAQLHSRPGYYGTYLALWTLLPALLVTLLWSAAEPRLVRHFVAESLPANVQALSPAEQSLIIGRVASVARGLPQLSLGSEVSSVPDLRNFLTFV